MNPLQKAGSQPGAGFVDMLSRYAEELVMESKSQYPVVPLRGPTQFVNIVNLEFINGNYAIQLQLAELRPAPVQAIGDAAGSAIFEVGRFVLSPRALRNLLDKAQAAAKAYADSTGSALPTESQFLANAALPTLLPPQPPKDETNQP